MIDTKEKSLLIRSKLNNWHYHGYIFTTQDGKPEHIPCIWDVADTEALQYYKNFATTQDCDFLLNPIGTVRLNSYQWEYLREGKPCKGITEANIQWFEKVFLDIDYPIAEYGPIILGAIESLYINNFEIWQSANSKVHVYIPLENRTDNKTFYKNIVRKLAKYIEAYSKTKHNKDLIIDGHSFSMIPLVYCEDLRIKGKEGRKSKLWKSKTGKRATLSEIQSAIESKENITVPDWMIQLKTYKTGIYILNELKTRKRANLHEISKELNVSPTLVYMVIKEFKKSGLKIINLGTKGTSCSNLNYALCFMRLKRLCYAMANAKRMRGHTPNPLQIEGNQYEPITNNNNEVTAVQYESFKENISNNELKNCKKITKNSQEYNKQEKAPPILSRNYKNASYSNFRIINLVSKIGPIAKGTRHNTLGHYLAIARAYGLTGHALQEVGHAIASRFVTVANMNIEQEILNWSKWLDSKPDSIHRQQVEYIN